jgi:hypothetical protein
MTELRKVGVDELGRLADPGARRRGESTNPLAAK